MTKKRFLNFICLLEISPIAYNFLYGIVIIMNLSQFELAHGECEMAFFVECQVCDVCRVQKALAEFAKEIEAQQEAELEAWIDSMEEKYSSF